MYLFWLVYRSGLPLVLSVAASASCAAQVLRNTTVCTCHHCSMLNWSELFFFSKLNSFSSFYEALLSSQTGVAYSAEGMPELSEADMVIYLGDLNYRLDGISCDEARDFVSQRCFDWLREKDQLRAEMEAGNVFQGMCEADIRFPPTYKFERHQVGLAGNFFCASSIVQFMPIELFERGVVGVVCISSNQVFSR